MITVVLDFDICQYDFQMIPCQNSRFFKH